MTKETKYDTFQIHVGLAISATFTKFAPKGGKATHLTLKPQDGDLASQISEISGNKPLKSQALEALKAVEENPNKALNHVEYVN